MEKTNRNQQPSSFKPKHAIWDCGSSLYDSFELKSFEKQLDAAISSRTLSMPHLSDRRLFPPPPHKKSTSRISRSLQRLIRSFFKPRHNGDFGGVHSRDEFYAVHDRSNFLSTIPEGQALVRRTASDRFADVGSIGVC